MAPLQAPGQRVVLETEKSTVDVRLEREPDPAATVRPGGFTGGVMAGKLLRLDGDTRPLPRTPVLVFAGSTIVRSTLVKPCGRFHAEGLPKSPLSLCLLVGHEECIEVPLHPEEEP